MATRTARSDEQPLDVRVWFSEGAAACDGLRERVVGYLEPALAAAYDRGPVELTFGGTVDLPAEGGKRLLAWTWPRRVLQDAAAGGAVDPVDDVNLLVTDGDPGNTPSGHGMPHVAAVTGATDLAAAPPRADLPGVVDYSRPAAVGQLLLHEVGHALGLGHEHGSVTADGEAVVASPMVSSYAWASDSPLDDEGACGQAYPESMAGTRRLALEYAPCARATIRSYDGGLL